MIAKRQVTVALNILAGWVAAGALSDTVFLWACDMMRNGRFGEVLKASFSSAIRQAPASSERGAIARVMVVGFICPPFVMGALIRLAYRVRQERARLREYGRG